MCCQVLTDKNVTASPTPLPSDSVLQLAGAAAALAAMPAADGMPQQHVQLLHPGSLKSADVPLLHAQTTLHLPGAA
jgi:hypothetical protein